MRPARVSTRLSSLGLLVGLICAAGPVQGDIRILQYDDTGRVAGVDQHASKSAQAASQDDDDAGPRSRFEPGEVMLVDPSEELRRQLSGLDFSVIDELRLSSLEMDLLRYRVPAGRDVGDALALLRQRFPGAVADANHHYETAGSSQAVGSSQDASVASWVRSVIGWPAADNTCGRGLRLGMIDASVDTSHPALAGQLVEFRSFHGLNRRPAQADHGTAVAAILVGRPSTDGWGGILPGAELKAANMFEVNEAGRLVGNAVALLKAIDWMAKMEVQVVNLSMAGSDNKALRLALQRARQKGLIMVAAAGNWGPAQQPAYPAAYDDVIAVTAFGADGSIYEMANRGAYIDFAAPGVRLWTAVPAGGRYQSGTSFATPYVSAQIAAAAAHLSVSDTRQLREMLRAQAVDMGSPGRDDTFGWGFIDQAPPCAS